jgi:hypothetical protein
MSAAPTRVALLAVAALCACITGRATVQRADASRSWPSLLAQAEAAANTRRYADADRLLADFALRYPDTDEAIETAYWRGVLRLDPAARDLTTPSPAAWFDAYLKNEGTLSHRLEAQTLQRLVSRLDTLATAAGVPAASATASQSAAGDRGAESKAKDAEIQKLKEELAKVNDELERIKRRLTQSTKP